MSVGKLRQGACQPKGEWCDKVKRLGLYLRDGFACLYCEVSLLTALPADITLDHLQSRSAGGSNDAVNLVTACRSCNSARGAKTWKSFASPEAQVRIINARRRVLNRKLARSIIQGEAGDPRLEV